MSDILKGNFKVKKPPEMKKQQASEPAENIKENLRKKALASLGGSMVYIERTDITWRGDE